jgi:hypothetical protein
MRARPYAGFSLFLWGCTNPADRPATRAPAVTVTTASASVASAKPPAPPPPPPLDESRATDGFPPTARKLAPTLEPIAAFDRGASLLVLTSEKLVDVPKDGKATRVIALFKGEAPHELAMLGNEAFIGLFRILNTATALSENFGRVVAIPIEGTDAGKMREVARNVSLSNFKLAATKDGLVMMNERDVAFLAAPTFEHHVIYRSAENEWRMQDTLTADAEHFGWVEERTVGKVVEARLHLRASSVPEASEYPAPVLLPSHAPNAPIRPVVDGNTVFVVSSSIVYRIDPSKAGAHREQLTPRLLMVGETLAANATRLCVADRDRLLSVDKNGLLPSIVLVHGFLMPPCIAADEKTFYLKLFNEPGIMAVPLFD